jgi:hypothetical protein
VPAGREAAKYLIARGENPRDLSMVVPHAFPQYSEIFFIRAQRGLGVPRAGTSDRHICSTSMNGPIQVPIGSSESCT